MKMCKAVVKGTYLGTRKGSTKDGKNWSCVDLYNNGAFTVFGLDFSNKKSGELVEVEVTISVGDGQLNLRA